MTRWRRSAVWATLLVALALVLTVTLGALHLTRFHESFRSQFESRAALSAQIYAESVGRASDTAHLQTLTQAFVRGDVLFAQIVQNGVVIAEDRTEAALEMELDVMDFRGQLQRRERPLDNGATYFELIRPLNTLGPSAGDDGPTYVRIGFSLERVRSALQSEALLTIGVGLALVLVVGLAAGVYLVRSRPRSAERGHAVADTGSPATTEPAGISGATAHNDETPAEDAPDTTSTASPDGVRVGALRIDPRAKTVSVDDRVVELTPKEYDLVRLLASEPGRVFSNREILDEVWAADNAHAPTSKDVKQYIYLLRQKLERDAGRPELIVTVRGFGYKLATEAPSPHDDDDSGGRDT